MIWDAQQRRYEDEQGRPLTPAEIRAHIEEFIKAEQTEVKTQTEELFSRSVTVSEFFAFMRRKVTAWHSIAGQIAYGGSSQMGREQWKRVNKKILSELAYLKEFEAQTEKSFAAIDAIADKVARDAKERVT